MRRRNEIDAMWVKICGNTNLEDAALAVELGADAVGFVFAASKRQVTAAQVGAITSRLPIGVERVGVFSSHDAQAIFRTASDAGLTTVQLHGGMDRRLLESLAEKFAGRVRIIQTLHWIINQPAAPSTQSSVEATPSQSYSALQLSQEIAQLAMLGFVDRILIDSKVGDAVGGTGMAYDWSAARTIFASAPLRMRLILAGGLTPANVEHAIDLLAPWGLDVSSGVEASPGKKDPALLSQFIRNARGIETP